MERVSGRVVDGERRPLAGASIVVDGREVRTDAEGGFVVESVPADATLLAKRPGYRRVTAQPSAEPLAIMLAPQVVKAAYLTYFGVSDRGIRGRVLDLAQRTELNAVVIDVKGDRGWIPYRTEVPLAREIAQGPVIMKDFDGLIADLKARGIYTIARVVTFKDNTLATTHPQWAVIDTRTGRPWIDNEKLAWVDPFREEVWEYNLAIAREAVRKGFDEVQFDYVRFPTDGRLSAARYSKPNTKETRLPTVAGFLARARAELGPLGVFVAADIFGYTAFNENDTDIGQRIEELAPHLDYMCPMVYPSGYHLGIPGYRNPVANPYAVVFESVKNIRRRAGDNPVRIRPWLQDFRDYAFDRRIFGVGEIRAQMKGADEAGAIGWMLWNPKNDYTGAALRPKGPIAAR
ncbi:MAG: carboxypeptidase regulatory-like domain-containing protein [Candidatus Rokubacteria bacterium]|nr:carboxypeptidase regulatory-like domain-containing protein [Candidatus Rokubacteria bacterium]